MSRSKLPPSLFILPTLIIILAVSVITVSQRQPITSTKSHAALPPPNTPHQLSFSPSAIQPNDSYTVNVKFHNSPYSGTLDVDVTYCRIDFSSCSTTAAPWKLKNGQDLIATSGKVTVPAGQNLPEGYYLARFKPRGQPDSLYTNFDVSLVNNRALSPSTLPSTLNFSASPPLPTPIPGSYMLFTNSDASGRFTGYTRLEVETDPCELGGYTLRHTKSVNEAYWNPFQPQQLRWCVTSDPINNQPTLQALGGHVYRDSSFSNLALNLAVTYSEPQVGLLGALGPSPSLDTYFHDLDQPYHYALLPPGNRIPASLSDSVPVQVYELTLGHPGSGAHWDTWHVDAFRANPSALIPGQSGVRIRYNETGTRPDSRGATWWQVQEDWTYNTNGLVSEIIQWWGVPPRCWLPAYTCPAYTSSQYLRRKLKLIDWYIPNSYPLKFSFVNPATGNETKSENKYILTIKYGQNYLLKAWKTIDGVNYTPYSGFLEVSTNPPSGNLWKDKNSRPIYVHQGQVIVGPAAYGNLGLTTPWQITISVRPYLTNSSLNSAAAVSAPKPNKSTAAFSSPATLRITP